MLYASAQGSDNDLSRNVKVSNRKVKVNALLQLSEQGWTSSYTAACDCVIVLLPTGIRTPNQQIMSLTKRISVSSAMYLFVPMT